MRGASETQSFLYKHHHMASLYLTDYRATLMTCTWQKNLAGAYRELARRSLGDSAPEQRFSGSSGWPPGTEMDGGCTMYWRGGHLGWVWSFWPLSWKQIQGHWWLVWSCLVSKSNESMPQGVSVPLKNFLAVKWFRAQSCCLPHPCSQWLQHLHIPCKEG